MTSSDLQVSAKIEDALKKMLKGSVTVISTRLLADVMCTESDWVLLDSRELTEFEISPLPDAKWVGHICLVK